VPINSAVPGLVSLNVVASSQSGRSAATTIVISDGRDDVLAAAVAIDTAGSRAIIVDTSLWL
jgi:hypothetical protein